MRATWLKVPPDQFEPAIDFYRTSVLPDFEDLEGFCSASFMIEPRDGTRRVVDDLRQPSRRWSATGSGRSNCERATRELGADILDVGEFELALAHLRVPEMAYPPATRSIDARVYLPDARVSLLQP